VNFRVSFSWMAVWLGCLGALSHSHAAIADDSDRNVAAYSEGLEIRPMWMTSQFDISPNTSYLVNTQANANNFQNDVFGGAKNVAGIQQRYDDRTRDYGLRSQYGLNDAYENQAYTTSMTGFGSDTSHDLMGTARSAQQKGIAQSVRASENAGNFSDSVKAGSAVTAIASGNPVNFNLNPDTKVSTRTDLVHQNGEVKVSSSVVNFSAQMDARNTSDPVAAAQSNTERYSVSMSRPLSIFDLSSSVSYGGTTNCMRAAVSRPIYDHVVGEFDSVKGNDNLGVPSEQSLKLMYGISF
jgi:hypothetical protein